MNTLFKAADKSLGQVVRVLDLTHIPSNLSIAYKHSCSTQVRRISQNARIGVVRQARHSFD
jgi:hypothetical protein